MLSEFIHPRSDVFGHEKHILERLCVKTASTGPCALTSLVPNNVSAREPSDRWDRTNDIEWRGHVVAI